MSPVNAQCPKRSSRGYTLVELMIAVAIVSILATLAIYGVNKYVNTSKTVEARNALGQVSKDVATAFLRETMAGATLSLGTTAAKSNVLCSSGDPVPASMSAVRGKKYQSNPKEWDGGWTCLRFSMTDPQYYQYQYLVTGDGQAAGSSFVISAKGDLDADSKTSLFAYNGALVSDGENLIVILGANIDESEPDE
jgi:type IV pilus assembly protein PilA